MVCTSSPPPQRRHAPPEERVRYGRIRAIRARDGLRRLFPLLVLVLVPLVWTTACTDSDANRQFANGPFPSAAIPTMAPTPTPTSLHEASAVAVQVSPEALLRASGAPTRLYFLAGPDLWAVNGDGGGAHRVFSPKGGQIRAIAPSPSGDRVAILLGTPHGHGETTSLVVLSVQGKQLQRTDDLQAALSPPAGGVAPVARSLAWSPHGDQLLAAFDRGGLLAVPLSGEPQVLIGAKQTPHPAAATWSPAGDAVTYLAPVGTNTPAGLYVARTGSPPLDPVALVAPSAKSSRSVTRFAWGARGTTIFYVLTSPAPSGEAIGGDLFAIAPSGEHRRLIQSAGSAGPVAQIVDIAPAPGGNAVAYTVYQPSGGGMTFLSLNVQDVTTGATLRLPVPPGKAVTDLWWTAAGLTWRVVGGTGNGAQGYTGGAFTLYRTDNNGDAIPVFTQRPATPSASRAASPGASPAASPLASPSPGATPVASPALATPVASPNATPAASPVATPKHHG